MRVLQWLSQTRARTFILTQGSRSGSDTARRRASEQLIASCGGAVADWGGVWDKDFYQLVLKGDAAPFVRWTDELAEECVAYLRTRVDDPLRAPASLLRGLRQRDLDDLVPRTSRPVRASRMSAGVSVGPGMLAAASQICA